MQDKLELLGKRIIVTGGARGLGQSFASALVKNGANVVIADILEDEGFNVVSHNIENVVPIKNRLGLKDPALYSCHTAVVSGYVIEGHVPAMDIRRLLNERPDILGLTAPGMPQLSPGMASIIPKNYDVLSFNEAQQAEVYSRY